MTLGHAIITSYVDFTRRLMDKFEKKDLDIHFRDLAELRHTKTTKVYIKEFHRMSVMVTNISEQRLVILFIEHLIEPLRGQVKAFRPITLQDSIMRTQDKEEVVPKKEPTKPFI